MRELDHNAHSVFLRYYHLILVVKYRRRVFDEQVSRGAPVEVIRQYIETQGEKDCKKE